MLHRARQPPGAAGWAGGGGREGIWGAGKEEGWGWGGHPQPSVTPGGPRGSLPGLEWRVRGAGHAAPSEVPLEVVSFWKVRESEQEPGSPKWSPYATFPSV